MTSSFAHAVPDYFQRCAAPFLLDEPCLSLSSSGDLDDLLLVPDVFPAKHCDEDLWTLEDLFSEDSGSEAATALSLADTASDASTRLPDLASAPQQLSCSSSPRHQCLPLRPVSAPQIPASSFSLKLDLCSVANAWGEMGGGRPAIRISAEELASIAATIPSLVHKAACASAESALQLASPLSSEGSQGCASAAAPLSEEEVQARKAALARYKEKKSARVNNPSKKVRYEMRRINAEKRPRIKGRFVKKSELEVFLTQQSECLVPGMPGL